VGDRTVTCVFVALPVALRHGFSFGLALLTASGATSGAYAIWVGAARVFGIDL